MALKPSSKCSFTPVNSAFSLGFALYLARLSEFQQPVKDRGQIKEGAPADIVVYDYKNLEVLPGEVAHDMPGNEWRCIQKAKSYNYVLVNGEVIIKNDKETTPTRDDFCVTTMAS